jgi:hypothetical protein
MGKSYDHGRGGGRRPHPNGRKPSAPPPRSGRSTFDGCAVVGFALIGTLLAGAAGLAYAAYAIVTNVV